MEKEEGGKKASGREDGSEEGREGDNRRRDGEPRLEGKP